MTQNNKNYLVPFVITQNKSLTQTSKVYITPFDNKSKLN